MMRVLQFVRFARVFGCVKLARVESFCAEIACVEIFCLHLVCAGLFCTELVRVEFVWLDFAPHDLREFLDSIRD